MATTTTTVQSIPVTKKRARILPVTAQAISNSRTLLSVACFYAGAIVLLLAALYPVMAQANFQSIVSSNVMAGILGGRLTGSFNFSAFLGLEVFSSIYGLLFGGILAWMGGAALPTTIEDGTLDLALSRPISRTRYYLESWLGILIGSVILGLILILAVWIATFFVNHADINWQWLWITQLVQWTMLFFAVSLGMLCGSCFNASKAAGGTAVGVLVLGYLLNTFGGLASQFQWMLKISPFYYAPAIDPLVAHHLTWWHPLLLVAAGLVCGIIGLVVFNRRDLPTV